MGYVKDHTGSSGSLGKISFFPQKMRLICLFPHLLRSLPFLFYYRYMSHSLLAITWTQDISSSGEGLIVCFRMYCLERIPHCRKFFWPLMQLGKLFMFSRTWGFHSRNNSRMWTNKSSRYHVLQATILQTLSQHICQPVPHVTTCISISSNLAVCVVMNWISKQTLDKYDPFDRFF